MISFAEQAEDVLATEWVPPAIAERKPELCIVHVPSIVIVIETGFGYYTYPMLVIETEMKAIIRDWSSDVRLGNTLHFLVDNTFNYFSIETITS